MSCQNHKPTHARGLTSQPMDPNLRLRRFGPIQPLAQPPSLWERLLFGVGPLS